MTDQGVGGTSTTTPLNGSDDLRVAGNEFGREARVPSRSAAGDGRSIGSLVKELGSDSTRVLREEIALAKAEMREKVEVYRSSSARMAVGGALLMAASLVVLAAMNRGLTALLAQWMDVEIAVWLAPLILAVVFGLIGWSLIRRAKEEMAAEGLAPKATLETIREEKRWVQEEMT